MSARRESAEHGVHPCMLVFQVRDGAELMLAGRRWREVVFGAVPSGLHPRIVLQVSGARQAITYQGRLLATFEAVAYDGGCSVVLSGDLRYDHGAILCDRGAPPGASSW